MQLERIALAPTNPVAAPPLLFMHGAWHGAWCWEPHFLPFFAAQGFAVEAFSLRAHGQSAGNQRTRGLRFKDYVTDLAEICQTYDQPPILIGHSAGGAIVQKYLETHPASAVILLASLPPDPILSSAFGLLAQFPGATLQSLPIFSLKPFVATPQRVKRLFFSPDMPLEKIAPYQKLMQDESLLVLTDLALSRQITPEKIVKRQADVPMLVLAAERDSVLPPKLHEQTARHYHATLQTIPQVAHDVMLEEHWQNAADIMLAWLRAHVIKERV